MIEYKEVIPNTRTGKGYEKVVWQSGVISYRLNDKLHREDGPAIIFKDGEKSYYLNGILVIPEYYHEFSPLELAKLGLI